MVTWKTFSDEELMNQLHSGDAQAYTEIFLRYNRLLVAHAYRLLADRDMACDVVQDILLSLWQKRETIRLTGSLLLFHKSLEYCFAIKSCSPVRSLKIFENKRYSQ